MFLFFPTIIFNCLKIQDTEESFENSQCGLRIRFQLCAFGNDNMQVMLCFCKSALCQEIHGIFMILY